MCKCCVYTLNISCAVFILNVTCGGVMGEGDLMLTLTVDNSMQLLTLITKDCGEGLLHYM